MRTSEHKLNSSLKKQIVKTFTQAVTDLKDYQETETFIKDFFTMAETETFAKRLAIAYWLKKKRSYTNIRNNLKVSSATIAEVSSLMKQKGFILILKKIEAEEWASKWNKKIKRFIK
ncbi:YerC/YecD family TrpR-related protein [Patescibacteria group bacterium]